MKYLQITLTAALSLFLLACSETDNKPGGKLDGYAPQGLYFNSEALAQVFKKTEEEAQAKANWARIESYAKAALDKKTVQLPPRGGAWPHFYVDSLEGKTLLTGKYLGNWRWEHWNADSSKLYLADSTNLQYDYDAVLYLNLVHRGMADTLYALGMLYAKTQKDEYRLKAQQILNAYSAKYLSYGLHNKTHYRDDYVVGTGMGRVAAQALGEATWFTRMSLGLDLLWPALDTAVKNRFTEKVIDPLVTNLQNCDTLGVHNITCWYNNAVSAAAQLTKDEALWQWANNRPKAGTKAQANEGFTEEGMWYERSPSYHTYALNPLLLNFKMATMKGDSSFQVIAEKSVSSLLKIMMPNGLTPRFNDSRETSIGMLGEHIALAYNITKSEALLPPLKAAMNYNGQKIRNTSRGNALPLVNWHMLFAPSMEGVEASLPAYEGHFKGIGVDVFREKIGNNELWMATQFDYLSDKHYHDHPDQLHYELYLNGTHLCVDPGHAEYGAAAHPAYYKHTYSHNTLCVDQEPQQAAEPILMGDGNVNGMKYRAYEAGSVYEDVRFIRMFAHKGAETMLIFDIVENPKKRKLNFLHHQRGTLIRESENKPADWDYPDKTKPRHYLKEVSVHKGISQFPFRTRINGQDFVCSIYTPDKADLYTGYAPGLDFEQTPFAMLESNAEELVVLWCVSNQDRKATFTKTEHGYELAFDGEFYKISKDFNLKAK